MCTSFGKRTRLFLLVNTIKCQLERRHLTKDWEFCVPLLRICYRSIVKVTIIDHDAAGDLAVHRFHLPTISELPFTSDKDPLVTCCGRAQHRKDRRSDSVSTTTEVMLRGYSTASTWYRILSVVTRLQS